MERVFTGRELVNTSSRLERNAALDRQRNVACREVASDGTENFWIGFLYGVYRPGNDF